MKDKNKLNSGYGFNRYMVECESTTSYTGDADTTGFNRYMVECEYLIGGNLLGAGTKF